MNSGFKTIERIVACPLCGSVAIRPIYHPDVERCENCRVYFRNPRPTQAEIQRSYDSGAVYTEWQRSDPVQKLAMWQRRLARVVPFKPRGRLLDVGTGDGFFLDVARKAGYDTCGTEISKTGADLARKRGHELLLGQLEDIDFKERRFDIITLWHVLEHCPDPGQILKKVFQLLDPGGVLAVAVPNEENRLFRYRLGLRRGSNPLGPLMWGEEVHLTHFQPATLRRALKDRGVRILQMGVDDIYTDRRRSNLAKLGCQKMLNSLTGWHFSMAMYAICIRAVE